ncbi:hypothetical protein LIER_43120 [Lithospermum erythrorhizon]|uniref:Uncharacterized protein n=1 Tax=Lithospermum erythrorhizon TaxID=34254 RepID=A0AAV3P731_LITER
MAEWKCILMIVALLCIGFSSAHDDDVKPEVHVSETMEPKLTARLLKDSYIHPTDLGGGSGYGYIRWGGSGGGIGQGWGSGGAFGYGQGGGWGSGSGRAPGYGQGGGWGSGSGGAPGYGQGSGWGSGSGGTPGYSQGSGWGSGGTPELGQGGGWGSESTPGFGQGGVWGSGQGGGWGSSGSPGFGQRGGQFGFGGGGSIGFIPPFTPGIPMLGIQEPFHCKPASCLSGVPCPNKFLIYPTQNNDHKPSIKKEEAMAPSPST